MSNGEPYGGQAWIQQAITAAVQAAMQQINWSQLMGYGYESMYAPQAPTRADALLAIWENRSDIQAFYYQNWGDPADPKYSDRKNWRPEDAIENWLTITHELDVSGPPSLKGDETPEEIAALEAEWADKKMDPLDWAIQQGYVTDYSAGAAQPTLERQRMEADEAYRQALLEFDQEKQAFIEAFAYDEMALNEALERLRLSQEQQRYMNEYEIAQAQLALQQELGMGDLQLRELMRLDQVSQQAAELDWAREMYYDQSAFASRQQDWAEWMGKSDLELRQELADLEAEVARGNLALEQRRFDLEDFLARDQNARENKYYELEYIMAMSQEERAGQRFQFEQTQWGQQFGLEEQRFGLEEQLGYGELGLGYLNLLAGLRGPQDWQQYWNVLRAAEQTPLPAWAGMLQGGTPFPAFGVEGQIPAWQQQIEPQQVSPQQWWSMAPSEQQGLQGMVETGGGWMPDWMRSMQAAWPQGQATPISYFA